jgi:hypothetical protein
VVYPIKTQLAVRSHSSVSAPRIGGPRPAGSRSGEAARSRGWVFAFGLCGNLFDPVR